MKRAQLSIFILIGLFILLIIGFFVFFSQSEIEQNTIETATPIQVYVEQCIQDIGNDAINYLSLQGGYYKTPSPYYTFGFYNIPYYYYENNSLVPTQQDIEEQLGYYINQKMPNCIDNFTAFTSQGYNISTGSLKTTVSLKEDRVVFSVYYPLIIKQNVQTTTYTQFTAEVMSSLHLATTITQEIIEFHDTDANMPLSKITKLSEKYNVSMNLGNFNDTVIYAIALPDQKPSVFMFAVKYSWGETGE
ncbi:MAG: hypothetical protein WC254_05675 [Candidatus Woesearchaeota archaeon]|jgi:hypothetical protein